jgi:hypothetical protein
MPVQLSDPDITVLLAEPKSLPADYQSQLQLRPKSGHKERELDVTGSAGSDFQLIIRQSLFNPLDFSVILGYLMPGSNVLFRLRRYGRSHEHTNRIEGNTSSSKRIPIGFFRMKGILICTSPTAWMKRIFADSSGVRQMRKWAKPH